MRGFFVREKFTLGKQERLKSRKRLEHLFRAGKVLTHSCLRVHYVFSPSVKDVTANGGIETTTPLKAAFGVGKHHFKKSTDRNKAKRLLREAYRLQKGVLQEHLQRSGMGMELFLIYASREKPGFENIMISMQEVLKRLHHFSHGKH